MAGCALPRCPPEGETMSAEHSLEAPGSWLAATRPLGRVRAAARRHPLAAFLALAYAFSWAPSIPYLVTGTGPPILSFGPALAAFVVLALTSGRHGVRALGGAMLRWRVGARWWAV